MDETMYELAYLASLAAIVVYSAKGYMFVLMHTPEEHDEAGVVVATILLVAFGGAIVTLYALATRIN